MPFRTVQFFDIEMDDMAHARLLTLLRDGLHGTSPLTIATVNPEMLLAARASLELTRTLRRMSLRIPDGVGLSIMSRLLFGRWMARHPGSDLFVEVCRVAAEEGARVVVAGGWGTSSQKALAILRAAFPTLDIVGISDVAVHWDGETWDQPLDLVERVRVLEPCVVAVALGSARYEKQERWIVDHASQIPSARILMGIGGTLDMVSGRRQRAPLWMQSVGMEWAWRVMIEPKRVIRIWRAVVLFPLAAILDRMSARNLTL